MVYSYLAVYFMQITKFEVYL